MKWFLHCLKNYANFKGRAPRKEYWFYTLFVVIIMMLAMIADYVIFKTAGSWFYYLAALFFFLPNLAVWTRRLHDIGRSGWNIFWYYIVCFIWGIVLVAMCVGTIISLGANAASIAPTEVVSMMMESVGLLAVFGVGCVGFMAWAIILFVWICTKGTNGDNKYGSDPLAK